MRSPVIGVLDQGAGGHGQRLGEKHLRSARRGIAVVLDAPPRLTGVSRDYPPTTVESEPATSSSRSSATRLSGRTTCE